MIHKITDAKYILPQIQALSATRVLSTGTTEPMLIRGVDMDSGSRGQFVIKFTKGPRMSTTSACFETLGVWIGKELGLNVVEPTVVHVEQDFVDTIAGRDGFQNARNSIGINYGCTYVEGYMELIDGRAFLSKNLISEAQNIFAFDMFISNSDRGAGKPNVLTNGHNFLIYDHELAFSFIMLLPFLRNKTPWILGDAEKEMYNKHHFFSHLRHTKIDFFEFTERFTKIDNHFWGRVSELMPIQWQGSHIEDIKLYLSLITDHRGIFAKQLEQTLLT